MIRVLACHNFYQQPGGEDTSFAMEVEMLQARGHEVHCYTRHNDEIKDQSRVSAARDTFWSRQSYRDVKALIRKHRPDVLHCTNTFPLISPSVYYAAREEGVAVVQSLRNYRLLCPGAALLRDDKVCEDCLGKALAWRGVIHKCYRESRAGSAVVAGMLAWHRLRGTWSRAVDMYYALTENSRQKFVEGGMSANRIAVKPNFLHPVPQPADGSGGYAAFVGRLSPEKGVSVLLQAWNRMDVPLPLKIVGDGPQADEVRRAAASDSRIQWHGHCPPERVQQIVGDAEFLIIPSIWHEPFGRVAIEALAAGTPIVASRIGGLTEIIQHGHTGWHFTPGDADDLTQAIQAMHGDQAASIRHAAREEFMSKYTEAVNYGQLINIYEAALANAGQSRIPRKDLPAMKTIDA